MDLDKAHKLVLRLMKQHAVPAGWSFRFDHSKVRFGKCNYAAKEISLSRHLVQLNDETEVRETILHEIAHVLAPRSAGHGAAWKRVAQAIGCNANRCYGAEVVRPKPRFKGTCPACRRVIFRHRRSVIACGKCTRVFDERFAFVWE